MPEGSRAFVLDVSDLTVSLPAGSDRDNAIEESFRFSVTVAQDPVLVVGSNAADRAGRGQEHRVANPLGRASGEILGNGSDDVLIGDAGGSGLINKSANIALILDTSGSMNEEISFDGDSASRIAALKASVINLLRQIADTQGATATVRIIAFEEALDTLDVPGDGRGDTPAEATFDNVSGDHFELIFHGLLPVYYDVTN